MKNTTAVTADVQNTEIEKKVFLCKYECARNHISDRQCCPSQFNDSPTEKKFSEETALL
jgi:hypothetical protein